MDWRESGRGRYKRQGKGNNIKREMLNEMESYPYLSRVTFKN